MENIKIEALLTLPGDNFLAPYIEKCFLDSGTVNKRNIFINSLPDDFDGKAVVVICKDGAVGSLDISKISYLIIISSTLAYAPKDGTNLNELTAENSDSEVLMHECTVKEMVGNVPTLVLRLPELVIGTNMDNIAMDMVHQVYRGTYMHIDGADAYRSAIHASSVAEVVRMCTEKQVVGTYILTDGMEHPVSEIAEALSFRVGNKRIFTSSAKRAGFLRILGNLFGIAGWGSKMYDFKTTTCTFSAEKLLSILDYRPMSVTEYLKTHVYDENSL